VPTSALGSLPRGAAREGITQLVAAERVGIRNVFVSQIEAGKRGMRWPTPLAFLRAYKADLHEPADAIKRAERD
jgi:transcriptional regulator with XRE-family HTH domain